MRRLSGSERVVVRAPSHLGDFVMAEPALRALHRRLLLEGSGELALCAPATLLELLEGELPGARRAGFPRGGREGSEAYRGADLALFLDGSARSPWLALRAGVRERIASARGGRAWLASAAFRPALERGRAPLGVGRRGRFPRHLPRPFAATAAELLGWLGAPVRDPRPRLRPTAMARERAEVELSALGIGAGEPFALLNVAAREGSAKAVPLELWRDALSLLGGQAPALVAHSAPGEEGRLRALLAAFPRLLALPAPELPLLLGLIERAALYVTADGGPRHLAAALGRPLVALFGPTDPRHSAADLGRSFTLRVEVDCGPCHRERCPLRGERVERCMRDIDPAALALRLRDLPAAAVG
jgi:heptosyltransferase-2